MEMLHLDSEQNQQTHYQQVACLNFYGNIIIETRNLGEKQAMHYFQKHVKHFFSFGLSVP